MMTRLKKAIGYSLFLILLIWICGYGVFLLHIRTLKPEQPTEKTEAVIVLTGGKLRINAGLEIYANDLAPKLFITGVHSLVKENEIKAMWNGSKPLPKCCITLGRIATTTTGNAEEAKEWIEDNNIHSIRLVTSNYHMPRALMEFTSAHIGSELKIITHPVHEKGTSKYYGLALDEYNKTIFRWSVLTLRKQGLSL